MYIRKRIILNILIIIGSVGSWLYMVFNVGGQFTSTGLGSLKYFTVLSNLFEGAACIIWIAAVSRHGAHPDQERRQTGSDGRSSGRGGLDPSIERAEKIKYAAAVSVALTLLTVMGFLGPLYGYLEMLSGVNLPLHLLVPVAAIAECIFMSDAIYSKKDNLLAVVPMFIYGVFYLGNNIINGTGEWPDTNDWYGFLNWGLPVGLMIFAALCIVTWAAGYALRRFNNYYDVMTFINKKG